MKKFIAAAVAAAAIAVPLAPQAAASPRPSPESPPGLCWNGYFWNACFSLPRWEPWRWDRHWDDRGHGHGRGHDDWR